MVRDAIQQLRISPYDESSGRGDLRYLQLTASGSEISNWLAQNDPTASVQVRFSPSRNKLGMPWKKTLEANRTLMIQSADACSPDHCSLTITLCMCKNAGGMLD